jgi:hypothetical protein
VDTIKQVASLALLGVKAGRRFYGIFQLAQHSSAINGHEVRLDVESVKAMAQPAGTFFIWG